MTSLIYKATKANINIYAYLFLEQLNINKDSDISFLVENIKLLSIDVKQVLVNPLIVEQYITILNDGSINITPKGRDIFKGSDAKYLAVMKLYPTSLYLSGSNFPAKVSDKRCIEVLSAVDTDDTILDRISKAIKYGVEQNIINMKFDKFIESRFYEAILEKIENDTPINYGIYGQFFES